MRSFFHLFPVAVALAVIAAVAPARAGDRAILHLYTWSSYFAPDVLAEFEDKYDCHVAIDLFDSNEEMLEAVEAGGRDFDIVTPSGYMTMTMQSLGLLAPLDRRLVPNLANVDPGYLRLVPDDEMRHSVPYTRTVTGIGYNRERLGEVEESWGLFGRTDLAGRMTMLDDMRETIGAALKYLGYSLNTVNEDELLEARNLLLKWKENLAKLEVDQSNLGLGSGELLAAHAYNGDAAVLMEAVGAVDFFVPREGAAVTTDFLVLLAGSANSRLAHAFINHMLDPDVAARNMEEILYYMPIPEALPRLPAGLREDGSFAVPDEVLARCEPIRGIGDAEKLYSGIWAEVTGVGSEQAAGKGDTE